MNKKISGMRLFVTIVDRHLGNKVVKLFEEAGCYYHQIVYGNGTAPSEIYEYLGFGEVEKDIVLSVAPTEIVPFMIDALKMDMHFDQAGYGVACTIPLDSVAGKKVLEEILRDKKISKDDIIYSNKKEEK